MVVSAFSKTFHYNFVYLSNLLWKILMVMIKNRTLCRPIHQSVIIPMMKQITNNKTNFVNDSYDYRPNWTPLSPVTIWL